MQFQDFHLSGTSPNPLGRSGNVRMVRLSLVALHIALRARLLLFAHEYALTFQLKPLGGPQSPAY
jgi:hypothetical protein